MMATPLTSAKIRVLVVDDSALMRRLLCHLIGRQEDFEVVGAAPDPFVARDMLQKLRPDVMTLDLEMPRMDGLTFLKKVMHYHPMPVVIISSMTTAGSKAAVEALRLGAIEVLPKPSGQNSTGDLAFSLVTTLRAAALAKTQQLGTATVEQTADPLPAPAFAADTLIAVGASTGGTQALETLLASLPVACPPLVIAQHIPAGFSAAFANRLNSICQIEVKEAQDGDELICGRALIAPGDFHMIVGRLSGCWRVVVRGGPRVCYQRPSVDVLFRSAAECGSAHLAGILLTGMGTDGAEGLLQMRQKGAQTFAQDEETCVIFGMPKSAIEIGAAAHVLPLPKIMQAALASVAPASVKLSLECLRQTEVDSGRQARP